MTDTPVFAYRGLLLDTLLNFVAVEVLRRMLDAMAASKLNTSLAHHRLPRLPAGSQLPPQHGLLRRLLSEAGVVHPNTGV